MSEYPTSTTVCGLTLYENRSWEGEGFVASRPREAARATRAAWYGVAGDRRLFSIRQPRGGPAAPIHVVVGWAAELAAVNSRPGSP